MGAARATAALLLACTLFSIVIAQPTAQPARRASVAAAAEASPIAAAAGPAAGAATASTWDKYTGQTAALQLGQLSMGDQLGNVLAHKFSTPLWQIQSSNVYTAGNARYRRVINDLRKGQPIKVVAIGGVATNGSDATAPGRNDYFAQYVNFLAKSFPNAQLTAVRSSVGVAPSPVLAQCLDNFLPSDADLVLLEMTANDGVYMDDSNVMSHNAKAYELVMRKILQSPKQPALLLTQTMVPGMGNGTRPFYLTPEAPQYAAMASFYGTPVVSMRNALWRSGRPDGKGHISLNAVSPRDGSTPLDAGHKSITDTLAYLTQRTAQDLVLLPYGDYDRQSMAHDVPERGVYSDVVSNPNSVIQNSTCFWIRNISSQADRKCPSKMAQMCSFDYTSPPAFLRTFDERGDLGEESSGTNTGVLVGAIVGGVVGGLLLLGGLLYCCIKKQKTHQKRIAEQMDAKLAQRKLSNSSSMSHGAVPITASAANRV